MDLYEVQRAEEGKGVHVRHEATGEEMFVHDVACSRQLVRGDYLFSRVVREEGRLAFHTVGLRVPRPLAEDLTRWMRKEQRRLRLEREDFLRRCWPAIRKGVLEYAEESWKQLRLTNSDGEPFEAHEAIYAVEQEAALRAALTGHAEIHESGEGEWVWLRGKPGEPGNTILGHLVLSEGRLRLSCNSRERIARGKSLLQEAAGSCLRHLGDAITPLEELKRRAAERGDAEREERIPPEVEKALIEQALENHYRTWPDTPLPALGGKTPRQAVRTPAGRRKVERLLMDFENDAEHARCAGRPAYDFSRLRRELGLS